MRFRGPFTDVITAELKLGNPSDKRVCFKVKTTAPKRYCVRPNSGIIEPSESVSVAVMLQPFSYDPNEKNKHKFMVQTMFAPDGNIDVPENMWKDISPNQLMDSKLKCVFELPVENEAADSQQIQNNLDANVSMDDNLKVNIKGSPEKSATPKASNVDMELRKALDECRRLNSELHKIREENNQLKEEKVRLRRVAVSDTTSSTPSPSSQPTVVEQTNAVPPIVYLIAAIVLGLILGKFIL